MPTNTEKLVACVAAVSFPFPGGDRTNERKSGGAKDHELGEQKIVGRREREEEGGGGRRGIACSQSQIFYRTPFAHERGGIVKFDWSSE